MEKCKTNEEIFEEYEKKNIYLETIGNIGIDAIRLHIDKYEIDIDRLTKGYNGKGNGIEIKIKKDMTCQNWLNGCVKKKISELCITDSNYNYKLRLCINSDGSTDRRIELYIGDANLFNQSMKGLLNRIQNILDILNNKFGVWIDWNYVTVTKMEINRTIMRLNDRHYDMCLEQILRLLDGHYGQIKKIQKETYTIERGNKSINAKFYNKSAEINIHNKLMSTELENKDVERFEITLLSSNKVKSVFGHNNLLKIKQEEIEKYYLGYISYLVQRNIKNRDKMIERLSVIIRNYANSQVVDKTFYKRLATYLECYQEENRECLLLSADMAQKAFALAMTTYPDGRKKSKSKTDANIKRKVDCFCANLANHAFYDEYEAIINSILHQLQI